LTRAEGVLSLNVMCDILRFGQSHSELKRDLSTAHIPNVLTAVVECVIARDAKV
jgi:hypothetical protein